jgi:hypothetical protein
MENPLLQAPFNYYTDHASISMPHHHNSPTQQQQQQMNDNYNGQQLDTNVGTHAGRCRCSSPLSCPATKRK